MFAIYKEAQDNHESTDGQSQSIDKRDFSNLTNL